jgi:hypothetical protein
VERSAEGEREAELATQVTAETIAAMVAAAATPARMIVSALFEGLSFISASRVGRQLN